MSRKRIAKKIITGTVAALALSATGSVFADNQKAGDFTIFAGWGYVDPGASADSFKTTSPTPAFQNIPINSYKNSNASTLALALGYMITDNWQVTFDFGIPPKTASTVNLQLAGHPTGDLDIADLKFFSPMLMGRYVFGSPKDAWRFNLGVGLAYTKFSDVNILPAGAQFANSASVDSKITPVISGGVSYAIDDHWMMNGTLFYNHINSTLHTTSSNPLIGNGSADVKLSAVIGAITVGYTF